MPFNDKSPQAAQHRYEQAMIDADIEGLAQDPEAEALVAQWTKDGVDHDEQLKRLIERYSEPATLAAE